MRFENARRGTALRTYDSLFIGGDWVSSSDRNVIEVVSPHTELVIGHAPEATVADVDCAVRAARAAFDTGEWPRLEPAQRAEYLTALAAAYGPQIDEMARLITEQMGSPISYSQYAQAMPGTMIINAGVTFAADYPWEELRRGELADTVVRRAPVGVAGRPASRGAARGFGA